MLKTARIRLTAWYILILMSVSIAFSVAIFRGMSTEVERFAYQQRLRVERRFDELGIPRPLLIDDEMIQDAKQKTVILQFLFEAIILTITGGVIGMILGIFISFVLSNMMSLPFTISSPAIFLAMGVSGVIGVVFGWYPAQKVSKLQPIEALRYE